MSLSLLLDMNISPMLASGALMVIDAARSRVRTLPLHYADD